jgi:hypothetical protein
MSNASIRVVKLITGDEIIGVVRDGAAEDSGDENYTLENLIFVQNPMKVISEYDSKSKVHALYLADWIPAISDDTLPIDKQRVVTLGRPNKDLEEHYIDILLAQKLLDDMYTAADEKSDNTSPKEDATGPLDKLKKHKFEDDDIQ